jgi:hypothetical protein
VTLEKVRRSVLLLASSTLATVHTAWRLRLAASNSPGTLRQRLLLVATEPDTSRAPMRLDASCVPGMALLRDSLFRLCATLAASL